MKAVKVNLLPDVPSVNSFVFLFLFNWVACAGTRQRASQVYRPKQTKKIQTIPTEEKCANLPRSAYNKLSQATSMLDGHVFERHGASPHKPMLSIYYVISIPL